MDRGEKARGADAHASEWRRGGRPPDGGVTLAVLGTRRLQLRREKPRTEAGQAGGGGGAVLLSGHEGASDGGRTEEGRRFSRAFALWTRPQPWLSVPLDQNLLTLTSPDL